MKKNNSLNCLVFTLTLKQLKGVYTKLQVKLQATMVMPDLQCYPRKLCKNKYELVIHIF